MGRRVGRVTIVGLGGDVEMVKGTLGADLVHIFRPSCDEFRSVNFLWFYWVGLGSALEATD